MIDEQVVELGMDAAAREELWFRKATPGGSWEVRDRPFRLCTYRLPSTLQIVDPQPIRHTGPISRIFSLGAPMTLVVPSDTSSLFLPLALRMAHNLLSYLGIDCDIITDTEALARANEEWDLRGVMVFGGPKENGYARRELEKDDSIPIQFSEAKGHPRIQNRVMKAPGTGL